MIGWLNEWLNECNNFPGNKCILHILYTYICHDYTMYFTPGYRYVYLLGVKKYTTTDILLLLYCTTLLLLYCYYCTVVLYCYLLYCYRTIGFCVYHIGGCQPSLIESCVFEMSILAQPLINCLTSLTILDCKIEVRMQKCIEHLVFCIRNWFKVTPCRSCCLSVSRMCKSRSSFKFSNYWRDDTY